MPIQYHRDDAMHRVTVTLTHPVTLSCLKDVVDRDAAGRAWKYSVLCDAHSLSEPLSPLNTWELMEHVREAIAAHGRRGPVAVVASRATTAAIAQLYSAVWQRATDLQFKTFYDVASAELWLDLMEHFEGEPSDPERSGVPTVQRRWPTSSEPTRALPR
jgi:hypothetical protein